MKDFIGRHQSVLILGGIIFTTVLTFKNSLQNDFIDYWDDRHHITENDDIKSISLENIHSFFTSSYVEMYQPITEITYAIDYLFYELDPWGYHLTNLILHLSVIIVAFLFLMKIDLSPFHAGIITLLFSTNVLCTEPVVWISARSTLLSALFIFSGLWIYIQYLNSNRNIYLVLTLLLYTFSLFTRITAIIFPFLIVLIEIYTKSPWFSKKLLLNKIYFIIISVPIVWIGLNYRQISDTPDTLHYIPYYIIPRIMWYLDFWIPIQDHSLLYNWPDWFDVRHLSFAILIIILTWILIKRKNLRRSTVSGILFFLISLGPYLVYSMQISPVADRYGYIPLFGLYFILGTIIHKYITAKSVSINAVTTLVLLILLSLNIWASSSYSAKWKDSFTIWKYSSETVPLKAIIHAKLGAHYVSVAQWDNAERAWEKAYQQDPKDAILIYNLASLKFHFAKYVEAIKYYNITIDLQPSLHAYSARAKSYYNLDMCEEAIQDFNRSISLEETDPELYFLRGMCKIDIGASPCADFEAANKFGYEPALTKMDQYCK